MSAYFKQILLYSVMQYTPLRERYYKQIISANSLVSPLRSRYATIINQAKMRYGIIGQIITNLILSSISLTLIVFIHLFYNNILGAFIAGVITFITFDTKFSRNPHDCLKCLYLMLAFLFSFNWIIVYLVVLVYENLSLHNS